MMDVKTAVVSIGNEILLGKTVNTNLAYLATELALIGLPVSYSVTIRDEAEAIETAVRTLSRDYEIVITTGGLGPTADDITKQTVAACFGKQLRFDEAIWAHVQQLFLVRSLVTPEINRNQAMVPEDFEVLENARGTAPGLCYRHGSHFLFMLPGVPFEMKYLFDSSIRNILQKAYPISPIYQRTVHTSGVSESALAEILSELAIPDDVSMAWLPQTGRVDLRFYGVNMAGIADMVAEVLRRVPEYVWGFDEDTPVTALQNLMVEKGLTLSIAESCTGGYIQKIITDIAGSSQYFLGGAIVYSNELKTRILNISPELLTRHGAVSYECADAMAIGIKTLTGSDVSISVTGIAGPDGGDPHKPVGTVYFGYIDQNGSHSMIQYFTGDRETIRLKASEFIVLYLLKNVRG